MAEMHKPVLLFALLAALLAISCSGAAAPVRMHLTHTDAGRGLTRRELLQRMALRSKARAARFHHSGSSASAQVVPGKGDPDTEYRVKLTIGTPPQPVELTLDTGSDLVWTQCQPCFGCYDQALPYFHSSRSSTFSRLPCGASACQGLEMSSCGTRNSFWGNQTCVYTVTYGDKSVSTGILGVDKFSFAAGHATVPGVTFGCGVFNHGTFTYNASGTGIAGFGRGPLSLPSQLKVDNFSYCFTSMTGSKPSPVLLGLPSNLYRSSARGAVVKTTPFIHNRANPTYYYLSLKGITVGTTRLPVPESAFALTKNGTGGSFIDSGTSITTLPTHVYRLLRDAFVSQLKLQTTTDGGELLCFAVPPRAKPPRVPKLMFHFEGATLDLPRENYVLDYEDKGRREMCIVVSDGGELIQNMTVIGNYQQQNMHILYDLAGNKLSFVPAHCDRV